MLRFHVSCEEARHAHQEANQEAQAMGGPHRRAPHGHGEGGSGGGACGCEDSRPPVSASFQVCWFLCPLSWWVGILYRVVEDLLLFVNELRSFVEVWRR